MKILLMKNKKSALLLLASIYSVLAIAASGYSNRDGYLEALDGLQEADSLGFYLKVEETDQALGTFILPLGVVDFEGVTSFQFTLELEGVSQVEFSSAALDAGVGGQLSTSISAAGRRIELSWQGAVTSLADSASVLSIRLAPEPGVTCTTLSFTDSPTPIGAEAAGLGSIQPTTEGGEVCFEPLGRIAGKIYREDGSTVGAVKLTCISPDTILETSTGPNGRYEFSGLPIGESYLVIPFSDAAHDNGISVLDILILRDYIIGGGVLQSIDISPYQQIAMDIDGSGSISLVDILQLRNLRLGLIDQFINNTSWQFIDAGFGFNASEVVLDENYPQEISVDNLPGSLLNLDFIAVKIGDVDNSAIPIAGP